MSIAATGNRDYTRVGAYHRFSTWTGTSLDRRLKHVESSTPEVALF